MNFLKRFLDPLTTAIQLLAMEDLYVEVANERNALRARVNELLERNNSLEEEKRQAERAWKNLVEAKRPKVVREPTPSYFDSPPPRWVDPPFLPFAYEIKDDGTVIVDIEAHTPSALDNHILKTLESKSSPCLKKTGLEGVI